MRTGFMRLGLAAALGALALGAAGVARADLASACRSDIAKFCRTGTPVPGRDVVCLHANADQLSPECRAALDAVSSQRHPSAAHNPFKQRSHSAWASACNGDVAKF